MEQVTMILWWCMIFLTMATVLLFGVNEFRKSKKDRAKTVIVTFGLLVVVIGVSGWLIPEWIACFADDLCEAAKEE